MEYLDVLNNDQSVYQLFSTVALRYPDKIALRSDDDLYTYKQLSLLVDNVSHVLLQKGIVSGERVCVLLERQPLLVVLLLSLMKLRITYIPLDARLPRNRIEYMLQNANASNIITGKQFASLVNGLPSIFISQNVLSNLKYEVGSKGRPSVTVRGRDTVYIIYTSGSTGKPKGVEISHDALVNVLLAFKTMFGVTDDDVFLALTTISFDIAGLELYLPLISGASLYLMSDQSVSAPKSIVSVLNSGTITLCQATPTMWQLLFNSGFSKAPKMTLISGGEKLPRNTCESLIRTQAKVYNCYGPTEATIWVSCKELHKASDSENIGSALANTEMIILDEDLNTINDSKVGEICIRGVCLAKRYIKLPELTNNKFILQEGQLVYRTGDLGRRLANGEIEIQGRRDNAFKYHGHFIAPEEIETILNQHEMIERCVVALDDSQCLAVFYSINQRVFEQKYLLRAYLHAKSLYAGWKAVWDETYSQSASTDSNVFVGWNSKYTQDTLDEQSMNAWLQETIKTIKLLEPKNIFEIGCGNGVILHQLINDCDSYYGCDISESATESLNKQVQTLSATEKKYDNVKAFHGDFYSVDERYIKECDLIILNSVVQYFSHGFELLRLLKAIGKLLKPGAKIFIGDIRRLELSDLLYLSLIESSSNENVSLSLLKQRNLENELLISPQFFYQLKEHIPQLCNTYLFNKEGCGPTELIHFRFDAVLDFTSTELMDEKITRHQVKHLKWNDCWEDESLFAEQVLTTLVKRQVENIIVEDVPNLFLLQLRNTLASKMGEEIFEPFVKTVDLKRTRGIDTSRLDVLFSSHGLEYLCIPKPDSDGIVFDFLIGVERDHLQQIYRCNKRYNRTWADKSAIFSTCNIPFFDSLNKKIIGEIQSDLSEHLPQYMHPSRFQQVLSFPLTDNQKTNRKELLAKYAGKVELTVGSDLQLPSTELQLTIQQIYCSVLGAESIGIADSFFQLGGTSILAIQALSEIEKEFDVQLGISCMFKYPSVITMSDYLQALLADSSNEAVKSPHRIKKLNQLKSQLSYEQERIWFYESSAENSSAYNIPLVFEINGELDLSTMQASLKNVVERNKALQLKFIEREQTVLQQVSSMTASEIHVLEFSCYQDEHDLITSVLSHPLTLSKGQSCFVALSEVEKNRYIFIVLLHHIICDTQSLNIFKKQFSNAFSTIVKGQDLVVSNDSLDYLDYCVWLQESWQDKTWASELAYWKKHIEGYSQECPLSEYPSSDLGTDPFEGDTKYFTFDDALSDSIVNLSKETSCTVFSICFSALYLLIYAVSGADDIVIGTDITTRDSNDILDVFGFFSNILPVRLKLLADVSYVDFLLNVQDILIEVLSNKNIPFARIVRGLNIERNADDNPIFQISFAYEDDIEDLQLPGLQVKQKNTQIKKSPFNLTLSITRKDGCFSGFIQYKNRVFSAGYVNGLVTAFTNVVKQIIQDPFQCLDAINSIDNKVLADIFDKAQGDESGFEPALLHECVERYASFDPDAIALTGMAESDEYTYGELNGRANQIARYLLVCSARPDPIVVINCQRSSTTIIAIIAILKAGGTYVPMRDDLPVLRKKEMINKVQPDLIISTSGDHIIEELNLSKQKTVILDETFDEALLQAQSQSNLSIEIRDEHSAYIIFTSGTTGSPKGVEVSHKSAVNVISHMNSIYNISPKEAFIQSVSLDFDPSVWTIFWPLLNGARLVLGSIAIEKDLDELISLIDQYGVSFVHTTPSHLSLLLSEESFKQCKSISKIIGGGEAWSKALLNKFFNSFPNSSMCNVYGPTEATMHVTTWECDYAEHKKSNKVYIGKPIDNVEVYILNLNTKICPLNVPGEIYIGGECLAKGYFAEPAITRAKFIDVELYDENLGFSTKRLYRTGDRGCLHENGNIEFLGRYEDYLKVRGYRVDLDEIISLLNESEQVENAYVMPPTKQELNVTELVAFVKIKSIVRDDNERIVSQLFERLKTRLPSYMIPSNIFIIDNIPIKDNGKIDQAGLRKLYADRTVEASGTVKSFENNGSHVATKDALTTIWAQLLSKESVADDVSFFELGGHSLLLVSLKLEIKKHFSIDISITDLFENSTIILLAKHIESKTRQDTLLPDDESETLRASKRASAIKRNMNLRNKTRGTTKNG